MALTPCTQEALHLRQLLSDIGFPQTEPTVILGDNQGALNWANNPQVSDRSKHIDVKYHFVREQVDLGSVLVQYVKTSDNLADGFTKPLPVPRHIELMASVMNMPSSVVLAIALWPT